MKLKHNPNYVNLPIRFLAGAIDTLIVWLVIISGAFFFFPANRPETLIIPAISYLTYYFLPISLMSWLLTSLVLSSLIKDRFPQHLGKVPFLLQQSSVSLHIVIFPRWTHKKPEE